MKLIIILCLTGVAVSAPSQEYICPCYNWFTCDSDTENYQLYFKTLWKQIPTKEVTKVNQEFKNNGVVFKSDVIEGIIEEFCLFSKEKRMNICEDLGVVVLDYYAKACSDPSQARLCGILNKVWGPTMDLFDSRHLQGKC